MSSNMSGEERMYAIIWSTLFICAMIVLVCVFATGTIKKVYGKTEQVDPDAQCIRAFEEMYWQNSDYRERAFKELIRFLNSREIQPAQPNTVEWAGEVEETVKEAVGKPSQENDNGWGR